MELPNRLYHKKIKKITEQQDNKRTKAKEEETCINDELTI